MSPSHFHASLADGEAVLQFPYDERLRQLLRALPGRRWDPGERAWCVPLDPERAEALARLFAGLAVEPEITDGLARAIERRRARRRHDECVLDLARPDENWWLSFATDTAPELAESLLEHPGGYRLPAIGRALIPLDDHAARLVEELPAAPARLRLTDDAAHALTEIKNGASDGASSAPGRASPSYEVELRRDRRGEHWIMIDAVHAPLARVLAGRGNLRALDGPDATFALATVEHDAEAIAELIAELDVNRIDPRVQSWLARATTWTGTIEVEGPQEQPVFLLLGGTSRLPRELREGAISVPGGASVPLTLETWRLMDGRLRGWISPGAKRCIAALREGRPVPPAVLEVSALHEDPTFVLAPGHDAAQLEAFTALSGAAPGKSGHGGRGHAMGAPGEHAGMPAIRADPFCVPELDEFLAAHETWIAPEALTLLQEVREEHAQAAGLVELSAATEAPLDGKVVPTLGGELKPFQRAGVRYLLKQRRAFLADEQGLGKTIEALATLEADGAYPAIVVCPASLKLNWLRELSLWLPHRSAQALTGTRGDGPVQPADVTVVNYDIVAARLSALSAIAPRALVLGRVPLLQERRREAHPGRAAALDGGATRRARARADGHARDEPPARADLPAADPRPAGRLRLGRAVRQALPRRRRAPAAALASARALLRAAAEGRRAAPAAGEDARGGADRARQRARVPPRRERPDRVAAEPAASTCTSSTRRSPRRCAPNASCG